MNTVREMSKNKKAAGLTTYPTGRPFPRFPLLTQMTYGLQGIFAVYGGTGIGKSTLAANLAADVVGEDYPVVYYDGENTFNTDGVEDSLTLARIEQSYDASGARFGHLRITADYHEAVKAVQALPRGALVVDTVQSSIALTAYDVDGGVRDALGARMAELAALSSRGYAVLIVSQINNRNATAPQPLGAMKGASAIEQALWAAVAYGVQRDTRVAVLQKLRRPVHPDWPKGSRITIESDGQDRLTEKPAAAPKRERPAPATPAQRLAQAQAANPGASKREIARIAGVQWATAGRLLAGGPQVAHGPVVGQSVGQAKDAVLVLG